MRPNDDDDGANLTLIVKCDTNGGIKVLKEDKTIHGVNPFRTDGLFNLNSLILRKL